MIQPTPTNNWALLRQPILLLLLVLVGFSSAIFYAYQFCTTQQQATETQTHLLENARRQLHAADTEKMELETLLPQYQQLITQGFIGEERRESWVNALIDIQKTQQLFEIQYEISKLSNENLTFLPNPTPFSLQQSDMQISFDLLHEDDLFTLTSALAKRDLSPWILKFCEISMSQTEHTTSANLYAQCQIQWLTLSEPNLSSQVPST